MSSILDRLPIYLFILSGASLFTSVCHFMEKGALTNHLYMFASPREQRRMNVRTLFRQSAIIFSLMSLIYMLAGLSLILHKRELLLADIPLAAVVVIYSVISTLRIKKAQRLRRSPKQSVHALPTNILQSPRPQNVETQTSLSCPAARPLAAERNAHVEFTKLIAQRRSVRKYTEGISHDALTDILTKAQMAPSWKNWQASRCYAVENPETLEALRSEALPAFNQNSSANAALIVTTFIRDLVGFTQGSPDNEIGNGWGAYDLGLHDAYLVLAASDAGYDTLIMGIRDSEKIRTLLNIPDNEEIMSVIAIGKRDGEAVFRPRKALEDVIHFI